MLPQNYDSAKAARGRLEALINAAYFPCIMAKAAIPKAQLQCFRMVHMTCLVDSHAVLQFLCQCVHKYNLHDNGECISPGRTIDFAETIFLAREHSFYSNRSNIIFKMLEDAVGRHDFLLTLCSTETFGIIYVHEHPHRGYIGNLCAVLQDYEISPGGIPISLNLCMHVAVDGETGRIAVLPPKSKANDYIVIQAKMDLLAGVTACSSGMSNNYLYKPIGYEIFF